MILAVDADVGDDENVLRLYDYEGDKKDDYPEGHLQICVTSKAWDSAGKRLDGKRRPPERLHVLVGGRRFRPTPGRLSRPSAEHDPAVVGLGQPRVSCSGHSAQVSRSTRAAAGGSGVAKRSTTIASARTPARRHRVETV